MVARAVSSREGKDWAHGGALAAHLQPGGIPAAGERSSAGALLVMASSGSNGGSWTCPITERSRRPNAPRVGHLEWPTLHVLSGPVSV